VANTPREVLEDYGQKFMDAFRVSLEKNGKYVSGALSQSIIAMPVKIMNQKLILEIRADEYFNYVNDGVDGWQTKVGSPYSFKKNGRPIPVTMMRKHIALRGERYSGIINSLMNEYKNTRGLKVKRKKPISKDKAIGGLAWAVGYNVKKKGIKPTHFADEVIESNLKKQMEIELSKSMGRMINIEIKKAIDGNNK
jgi:hypothetical protein